MSANFFIRKTKGGVKRKHNKTNAKNKKIKAINVESKARPKNQSLESDEISSDDEISLKHFSEDESDENIITAQEKKIKLAKKYLEEIEKEEADRLETADVQSNVVSRLRENLLSQAGKLSKNVADRLCKPEAKDLFTLRCKEHKLSVTCIAVSPNSKFFFSGSKDAMIVKWSLENRSKVGVISSKHKEKDETRKENSPNSSILSLAVSLDNKYLASSDESSVIQVWNVDSLVHIRAFKGHRSTVTGLAFCTESNHLYSCSKDRSVRIWNLDEMSFVESLFGHQCGVSSIDVLKKDRAVTSGGIDSTLRVWKVQEESQLIFNGHQKSIDRVRRLDQQHFASCGDDGQICVWGIMKKKPLCIISKAHGTDESNNEPNWITSISCLPNSDLIISGSCDGQLKFWKCEDNFRTVQNIFSIPVEGFINDLCFTKDERFLIVAIGQEHRLGRWFNEKKAKNSILLIPIQTAE